MRRFWYLISSRIATSHHGSAPWIMHSFSSGNRTHTRSRWIGFCTSPGIGGPGQPGVDTQRQLEFGALRVQRVVDGIAGRIHAVAPEARPDSGIRDRQVAVHGSELAQCGHRAQQIDAADRQREPVRPLLDELAGGHRGLDQVVHQDGLGDAVFVHLVEQLRQFDLLVQRLRALEVVVADLEHELGLLGRLAEVHVDQAVDDALCVMSVPVASLGFSPTGSRPCRCRACAPSPRR